MLRQRVSTSLVDTIGTLYLRFSVLSPPSETTRVSDVYEPSSCSGNFENNGITCRLKARAAGLAMVASQRCKTVGRSEDTHPYNSGTSVREESWARAGQGLGEIQRTW